MSPSHKPVLDCYTREYGSQPPIIYNGVPEVEQKAYDGLKAGKTNILFAGRFDDQKGIVHLVAVIKGLQDMPQYHFHVIGGGRLQEMVDRELGGLPNVTVRPPLYGISGYLASFDYMFMPSEFEGLPLMSVEAAFAGLPVVCSGCKGLNETIPQDWPLVAHYNSHEQHFHIFRSVIPNADRTMLSQQARQFVAVRFGVEQMQRKYEKLYLG